MIFITIDEFKQQKMNEKINDLIEGDGNLISEAEQIALSVIKTYLGARYDTKIMFMQKGTNRNGLMRRIVMDLMLCDLYMRTSASQTPDKLSEMCDTHMEFLKDANSGKIPLLDLPTLGSDTKTSMIIPDGLPFVNI